MSGVASIQILQSLREEVDLQGTRAILWGPVFFALGIIVYFNLRFEPDLINALAGLGIFSALAAFARRTPFFLPALMVCLIAAGFVSATYSTQRHHTVMLQKSIGPLTVTGTIAAVEPKELGAGSRLVLKDLEIEDLTAEQTPRRVRLLLRKDKSVRVGDRITGLARLNAPSGPVRPGAFDFQRHAYFKGIGAVGFFFSEPEILSRSESRVRHIFERARANIIEDVRSHVVPPYEAIVTTLLTGQRQAIREDDNEAMRDAGLAHLLAISGLHVGMVAGAIFFFIRGAFAAVPYLALRYPIKKWAAVIALMGAAYYTFVVGAAIPAQRALMMTGLVLIAIMLDRSPFSLRLVALAATVIMILSPEAVMGVSFQMSFAAVVCLIAFYDWVRPWWSSMYARAGLGRRVFMYFLGITTTTLIAGFATGLFALYHFQHFAVYGVVSNFIAVPIVGFIVMPAAVLYYVLSLVTLDFLALNVMEWGVSWVLATAHWTADLSGAVWHVSRWSPVAFALMVAGSLFSILWIGRFRAAGFIVCVIGAMLIPFQTHPDILIAKDVKLIGVRNPDTGTLSLSSGRAERYAAENWMRMNGDKGQKPAFWPRSGTDEVSGVQCDIQGCRLEIAQQRFSFPKSEMIVSEECGWADIVIAPFPVKCRQALVYDLFDARYNGSAVIYATGRSGLYLLTDKDVRGRRPWTGY